MKTQAFRCDHCGGNIVVNSRFAAMVTCRYCNTVFMLSNDSLTKTEITHPLRPLSQFSVGEVWQYQNKELLFLGRAEVEAEEDIWDEWFVMWNNLPRWIEAGSDNSTLFEKTPLITSVASYGNIQVGETLMVGETSLYVVEKGEAKITGVEGELPSKVAIGQTYQFVEAHAQDGSIWTIEYTQQTISLLHGNYLVEDKLTRPE